MCIGIINHFSYFLEFWSMKVIKHDADPNDVWIQLIRDYFL